MSRVQELGLLILFDQDQISEFVKAQEVLVEKLKIALITNDPQRLPEMYPSLVKTDNDAAAKALDANAPVEIKTTLTADQALSFLDMMGSLGLDDLAVGDI